MAIVIIPNIHLLASLPVLGFMSMTPGPLELLLIFTVVLLLFGAQNLPKIARTLGKTLEEFRRAAHEVTTEIINAGESDDKDHYVPPSQKPPPSIPPVAQADTQDLEDEDEDSQS